MTPERLSANELARINEVMDRARGRLKRTWNEVAARGGMSFETIRAARRNGTFSDKTRRGVEAGLEWEQGSFEEVAAGREPIPKQAPKTTDAPDAPALVRMSPTALALAVEAVREEDGRKIAADFLADAIRLREEWAKISRNDQVTAKEADRTAG